MSEATIEYKDSPNESTAYAVSEGQKTKVQLVATPAGDLELADNPNVDTGYLVINGEKHKCALVAEVAGELKLPTSATDDTGYVTAQDGRQHKVKLVANITGGGGGVQINNQDINVTQNGIYQAEEGYTGLGIVNVNVASGSPTQKFGATVDTWIGDVDANGVLKQTTWTGALNFAGVREIGTLGLYDAFYNISRITSVDFSSVQSIGSDGLGYAFFSSTNLTSVDFSSLETVGSQGLNNAFRNCKKLTSVDFSSLRTISSNGFSYAFNGCTELTSVGFSSLETVGATGLNSAFAGYTKITTMSFPSLTSVQTNSFGTASYSYAFANCTLLTEIHFRADMQATIEAMSGYSDKWGATNATIYFDL